MLVSGTQVRGVEPGRSQNILSMPSFRREVNPSVPCRRFAACKRSLQIAWNSHRDPVEEEVEEERLQYE
jgi:hypothetical protein